MNTLSQHTTGPCAHSSVSDLGQVTAAAQKDQSSTRKHTGLAEGNWIKGSKLFRWQNHPFGNHWRWQWAAAVPEEEEGGDAGRKDWPKYPWGDECAAATSSCWMSLQGKQGTLHPPGSQALAQPSALGDRSGHRLCPVPLPAPQPVSCLCHLSGPHSPASAAWRWGQGGRGACPWLSGALVLTTNISLPFSGSGVLVKLLSIMGWHWEVTLRLRGHFEGCCASWCASVPQQHLPSSPKWDRATSGFTHRQALGKYKESHWSSLKQQLNSFLVGKMLSHELSFKCRGRSL